MAMSCGVSINNNYIYILAILAGEVIYNLIVLI